LRHGRREQAGTAAQVEHRRAAARQVSAAIEIGCPAVLQIVEPGEIGIAVKAALSHSTPLPGRALGSVFQDHALGLQVVADAVGLLEVLRLARRLAGGDRRLDLGVRRPRAAGRRPAEPGFGILP